MLKNVILMLLPLLALGATKPVFSPSDGQGTAVVEPAGDFTVRSIGTWKIIFTVGEHGIAEGGGVVVLVSPFWGWTRPQIYSHMVPGYVTAKLTKGKATIELEEAGNYAVLVRVTKGHLSAGDTLEITYGDTCGGTHPEAAARIDKYSERKAPFYVKVDGDGDAYYKLIENSPAINITSGPPAKLLVMASSVVEQGKSGDLALSALDVLNNRVQRYTGTIELSSVPPGLKLPARRRIRKGDAGSARVTFKASSPGIYRVAAVDRKRGLRSVSNPIEVVSTPQEMRLYWADPHGHSLMSDGTGLPEDYYRYARDVALLDVSALTDHDAWGVQPLDENPGLWEEIKRAANAFNRPGHFVTYIGYEWTNWEYGHFHVLYRGDRGELYSSRSEKYNTPEKLWAALPKGKAITIPHHPGGGPVPIDWKFYNPSFEPVVEICSVHGISERYGGPLAIYRPVAGAFVQDALRRGYRLGFLGGGDSHTGHPGIPYVDAPVFGLSGIYARELTRDGIWEALFSRRTYATTGDRIILRFRINGAWMGEVIEATAPLKVTAEAVPCASVRSFELLRNNEVIHSVKQACLNYTYTGTLSPGDFFYVRLTQENDQTAFSSPIWISGSNLKY